MEFNFEKIIQETIEEYVDDVKFDDKGELQSNLPIVYQLAFEDRLPSIFKNGYSREFAATAGGNYYCTGVYTTFNLNSTIQNSKDKASLYGGAIVKLGIKSYERFFICNKKIAQKVYGANFHPEKQLEILFSEYPTVLEYIKRSPYYSTIIQTTSPRTAMNVAALLEVLGGMHCRADDNLNKYDIRGFVFHGSNDGDVAIIRDFKAIIPLAYSTDGAKTWSKKYFSQSTLNNSANDHDPIIFLGSDSNYYMNPQNYRFINGFMVVQRKIDGKYNFMDDKKNILFPESWFDNASKFDNKGKAMVKIGDIVFYVDKYRHVYEKQNDKYPVMSFEELLEELKNIG
jgi:hypothetical protein